MFIILAERRSGTHMLASLLDSHPNLRCYDEVLLPLGRKLRLGWKDITTLESHEGCIMVYRSFIKSDIKIRNLITEQKVIHIMRRNLKNHAVSVEKMAKVFNPDNVEWRKDEILKLRQKVFGGRYQFPHLFEIYYEDICNNLDIKTYENKDLLKFLGVSPMKLTTHFTKGKDP